jgi:ribosomal protein S18 acetylase RimI-like enzyme
MLRGMLIRAAMEADKDAVWAILEPVVRAGETFTLPREMTREQSLGYWFSPDHEVYVAEDAGLVVGTYYLRANQRGGGSHVANAGYITSQLARGRGIARAMCTHSLERARDRGFRAMQFNFVVATNERAIRLWQSLGFDVVGRLPRAFCHPSLGFVDALVMYRAI